MKLIISAFLISGLATSVIAGNSDRYNDQRHDTAVGHVVKPKPAKVKVRQPPRAVAPSTQNTKNPGAGYAYSTPYGVGPNNDSR